MTKYYMMKFSREGVQLYGGRQEDNGSYTVFEDRNLKQGGRIKMRSPPKVLTGNFRPSQLSFFLS